MARGPQIKWLAANSTSPAVPSYMPYPGDGFRVAAAHEQIMVGLEDHQVRFIDREGFLNHTSAVDDEFMCQLEIGKAAESPQVAYLPPADAEDELVAEDPEDDDFDITLCDLIDCTGLDLNAKEPSTALVIIIQPHGLTDGMIPPFFCAR